MDRATVIYMAECIQNALHRSMAKYPLLACSQTKPNCFPVEAHSWRVKTVAQFSRWRVLPYAMNNVSVENILFLLKYRHIINVWCAETESAGD